MMTFAVGEKVGYPNQGVGTIENISVRSFGSAYERFYLLRFGFNLILTTIQLGDTIVRVIDSNGERAQAARYEVAAGLRAMKTSSRPGRSGASRTSVSS